MDTICDSGLYVCVCLSWLSVCMYVHVCISTVLLLHESVCLYICVHMIHLLDICTLSCTTCLCNNVCVCLCVGMCVIPFCPSLHTNCELPCNVVMF